MERSVTPEDEARLKADEMDRRLGRIPVRERLEIGRRVNAEGASLVELVEQWERDAPKHRLGDPPVLHNRAEPEDHQTPTNPTGEVRQCDRRDIHDAHEWQAEFGAYFNVYCPGNDGKRR